MLKTSYVYVIRVFLSFSDAQGRSIDFRNTILVLTSNIGGELFGEKSIEEMSTDEVKKVYTYH